MKGGIIKDKSINKGSLLVSIFLLLFLIPSFSYAQKIGVSGGFGAGLFIASDEDYYGGIRTDLYPEMGLQLNISLVRLGVKFAYIYRKIEISGYYSWYDPYYGWQYDYYYYDYTLAYLPIQGEFLIAPLDATAKNILISPYFGFMTGVFVPTGDNEDVLSAFSIKLGSDINLEPLFMYGDIRYTYASHNDTNAGGFMVVCGMGVRFHQIGF